MLLATINQKQMTKAQLLKLLEPYPDNMEVFIAQTETDFSYTLVNSVYKKKVDFKEDPGGETLASHDVIVIDEK